jgi:hypothetical protein
MVHVSDLMKYASVLQRKYGARTGAFDNPFDPFPGSFKPTDLRRIHYIDSTFDCSFTLHQRQSGLPGMLRGAHDEQVLRHAREAVMLRRRQEAIVQRHGHEQTIDEEDDDLT